MVPTSSIRRRRGLVALLALALVTAAACGSDEESASTTAAPETTAGSETTAAPSSTPSSDAPSSSAPSTDAPSSSAPGEDGPGPAPQPLPEQVTIRVNAQITNESQIPAVLANHLGEFEKENIKIELTQVAPADAFLALANGQIDVIATQIAAGPLNAISTGVDVRAVLPLHNGSNSKDGLWLRPDLANGPTEGLKGLKIGNGLGPGAGATLTVAKYYESKGLAVSDFEIVAVPTADNALALQNGAVDGTYINSPYWLEFEEGVDATFVQDVPAEDYAGYWLFGPTLINDNRAAGEAYIRALLRTQRTYLQGDYKADPEVLAMLVEATGLEADVITRSPSFSYLPDSPIPPDIATRIQDVLFQVPDVLNYDEPLAESDVVDSGFRDAVLGS